MSGINSMTGYSNVQFAPKAKEPPTIAKTVSFRGGDYPYYNSEPKKSHKGAWIAFGTLAAVVAGIFGLGYAHKKVDINSWNDGRLKNVLKPVLETCDKWSSAIKEKCGNGWSWVKNLVGKKGG